MNPTASIQALSACNQSATGDSMIGKLSFTYAEAESNGVTTITGDGSGKTTPCRKGRKDEAQIGAYRPRLVD